VPALLQIFADRDEGQFVRANAAGYLLRFAGDSRTRGLLRRALEDPQPLVRAVAVREAQPSPAADRSEVLNLVVRALSDPVTTVRMGAAVSLVGMGVRQLDGDDQARFAAAQALYRERATLNDDDPGQDVASGKYFYLLGDMDRAIAAFRLSLRIDPSTPAQYFLGGAYAAKGDLQEAHRILEAIQPSDSQYAPAQRLLIKIKEREKGSQ